MIFKALLFKIGLPAFQRDYVWEDEQVFRFLRSFLNGEYLNNIILVENNDLGLKVHPLPFSNFIRIVHQIPEPDSKNIPRILLDGQQRLTTLLIAFFNDILLLPDRRKRPGDKNRDLKRFYPMHRFVKERGCNINDDFISRLIEYVDENNYKMATKFWWAKLLKIDGGDVICEEIAYLKGNQLLKTELQSKESEVEFLKALAEGFNTSKNDGGIWVPFYLLRYPIIKKIPGKNENGAKKLENILIEYLKEFKKSDDLVKSLIGSQNISRTELSGIQDQIALAEEFEKLNTTLMKLNFFDIVNASLYELVADSKDERSLKELIEKNDVQESFGNISNRVKSLKDLKTVIRDNYAYIIQGFNYYAELKNNFEKGLALRRKEKDKTIFQNIKEIYGERKDRFFNDFNEYIKALHLFLKLLNMRTGLLTPVNPNGKLDRIIAPLYFYGAAALLFKRFENLLNVKNWDEFREQINDSFKGELEDIIRIYLLILINPYRITRHPENLFRNSYEIERENILGKDAFGGIKDTFERMKNIFKFKEDGKGLMDELLKEIEFDQRYVLSLEIFNYTGNSIDISKVGANERIVLLPTIDGKEFGKDENIAFEFHHIFPKANDPSGSRENVFNIALISSAKNKEYKNKEPEKYWDDLIKENFECNFIPVEGKSELLEKTYPNFFSTAPSNENEFLMFRSAFIIEKLEELLFTKKQ